MTDVDTPDPDDTVPDDTGLAEAEQAMRAAQARLLEVPVEQIIGTHVVGLYELAALHLSATPPDLTSAATAIDAMSAVVHTLEGRLGGDEVTMRDALQNIQFAFVQIKSQLGG